MEALSEKASKFYELHELGVEGKKKKKQEKGLKTPSFPAHTGKKGKEERKNSTMGTFDKGREMMTNNSVWSYVFAWGKPTTEVGFYIKGILRLSVGAAS